VLPLQPFAHAAISSHHRLVQQQGARQREQLYGPGPGEVIPSSSSLDRSLSRGPTCVAQVGAVLRASLFASGSPEGLRHIGSRTPLRARTDHVACQSWRTHFEYRRYGHGIKEGLALPPHQGSGPSTLRQRCRARMSESPGVVGFRVVDAPLGPERVIRMPHPSCSRRWALARPRPDS
jgi:hypothetical protein